MKGITRTGTVTVILLCAAGVTIAATGIPAIHKEILLERNFPQKAVIPMWEHGFLFGYELYPPGSPPVYAYAETGQKLFETPLTLEGAAKINLSSMAASPFSEFAVSGSVYSNDGNGALFIARLDSEGKIRRVDRTGRFAPLRLRYTNDGSLWVLGRQTNYPLLDEPPDHDILRVYDEKGALRFSLLRRSTFPPSRSHPAKVAKLASNGAKVALLCIEFNTLVVVSEDGEILSRTTFPPPDPHYYVTGFAMSSASEIYMSCQVRRDFVFYRWDADAGRWQEIYSHPKVPATDGYQLLLGFSGDKMVVTGEELRQLKWVSWAH